MPPRRGGGAERRGGADGRYDTEEERKKNFVPYEPLEADPKFRKERLVDEEGGDVPKACRSLYRMRQNNNRPVRAPIDWHEYYSNLRVESWIYMWAQAMHRRVLLDRWPAPPAYQYHIPGKYVIGGGAQKTRFNTNGYEGRTVTGGAFIDFAWLPADRNSTRPIVLLECDENAHSNAGWDAERYREVFVLENLLTKLYRRCKKIMLIRFNPHEYKNKTLQEGEQVNVFTVEPSRDVRMANIRELVLWGLGESDRVIMPANVQITIVFAYYDKWYLDAPGDPVQPIHYHHYKDLTHYKSDVNAGSGRYRRLKDRMMFLDFNWWRYPNPQLHDEERTASLNPFSTLENDAKQFIREALDANVQGPAPPPPPVQPPPAPPLPPAPRRNPPRRARGASSYSSVLQTDMKKEGRRNSI